MAREFGMFPYSSDGVIAPNIDGTVLAVGMTTSGLAVDTPPPTIVNTIYGANNGKVIDGGISETSYVYCNEIAYGVFAGDS